MTVESLIREAYKLEKTASKAENTSIGQMKKIATSLEKISSLPYKAEAYEAICGIMKIASQVIEEAVGKVEELNKVSEVRGMIDEMLDRGLISKDDIQEKTSALLKKNERELEITKEAMAMTKSASMSVFDNSPDGAGSGHTEKNGIFGDLV